MKKHITILILLCSLSAQAQELKPIVGGVYLGSDTIVVTKWDSCSIFTGEPLRITGGYIMNDPLSVGGRDLFITAETRTFHPNEYRDLTPQQKPQDVRKLRTVASAYKITRTKMFAWSLIAVGSVFDGLLEGYLHDGRTSFERKWDASKTGFWGSESWRSVYVGGNPENGFKSDFIRWTGANDFYHFADDTRKIGYITGGVMIGIGTKANTKWWHYAVDFGISFAASAISKSAAYYYIRN
jgi:hypothetical protein